MKRQAAVLSVMMVACAGEPMPRPTSSTVTVARDRKILLAIDGDDRERVWACSNACKEFGCAANCPTARVAGGACTPGESSAHTLCRTFADVQTYDREGACADGETAGVRRISCVDHAADNSASRKRDSDVFGFIIGFPVLIIAILGAASLH